MRQFESLDEIKGIELAILKEVHTFCEENNLKYFLAYGTLLGSIRHNGFIPWDDDIDIWMLREDYDFFEERFPEWGAKRNLYIAGPHSKEHFLPRHMLKVCDDRTVLMESKYKNHNSMGLFIDIFPLDRISENPVIQKAVLKIVRSYKYRIIASNLDKNSSVYKNFNFIKKMATILGSKGNPRSLVEKYVKLAKRFSDNNSGLVTAFYSARPNVYSLKDFVPAVLHDFEDAQFYIPNGYDAILRKQYGDYMKLPPEEKRVPEHTMEAFYK